MLKIGYHGVIRRNGDYEEGRGWDEVGAHARDGGYNKFSLGLCLVGGVSENPQKHVPGNPWNGSDAEDNFTQEQFLTMFSLIKSMWNKYGIIPVIGHRDIPGVSKACPSFSVNQKMKAMFPEEYPLLYPSGFPSRWE
jgi:N-acetylmuramoyl-L-alanine amidase